MQPPSPRPAIDPGPSGAASLRFEAAAPGHYDERLGAVATAPAAPGASAPPLAMAPHWQAFFDHLGTPDAAELNRRSDSLARQIRDNGVTYNVYADQGGPQRPWSLDLFPWILPPEDWQRIESGVLQRVALLDRVMADVYGEQRLLSEGLLPSALVHGHPGYLRAMHGVQPSGGTFLHIVAFDLARAPDGLWWLVSQRTQAPSGLGYLLENRLAVSRLFPQAFAQMQVQRVAGAYRALMDSLRAASPGGADSHMALLTSGPYNETYFEHAYLARYLGITLVEGGDLLVRDQRLYLKTLRGLVPIHVLLKRLDDQFLDPLELRADSTLGVPGLLQAVRAGHLLVANAPGSDFLESPAFLGFLPAVARRLLGEELRLPALHTWWCGERSAMESVLPRLAGCAIKPTYPASAQSAGFEPVLGRDLAPRALDEWAGRIARQGDEHTVQAYVPLSQLPTWHADGAAGAAVRPRAALLRVFAVCNGPSSWQVLPGGLARVAQAHTEIATMQRGGSSADVWVLTRGPVDRTSLLAPALTAGAVARRKRQITSRAAENLFWLGRYTERTECTIALARLTLESVSGETQPGPALLAWLGRMAQVNALVGPGVPPPQQARRVFLRSLIAALGDASLGTSLAYNLAAVRQAASAVRERLSQEHWNQIVQAHDALQGANGRAAQAGDIAVVPTLNLLKQAAQHLAAITGAQTDRMTRDDGWRLLSIGRLIERLAFLARALDLGLETDSLRDPAGFDAMVALFDSTITFRAQFQQSHAMAALVDLLVLDRDNPRSLAWVAHTLRGRLARLGGARRDEPMGALAQYVPDPAAWSLDALCADEPEPATASLPFNPPASAAPAPDAPTPPSRLRQVLQEYSQAAYALSDLIGGTYFTHTGDASHSVGA